MTTQWWLTDPYQLELGSNWAVWQAAAQGALWDKPTMRVYQARIGPAWEAYREGIRRIAAKYEKEPML